MILAFSPAAISDIEEIGDYIRAENPAAAIRFVDALRSRCDTIADAPHGGAPRESIWPGLRSVPFKRYIIFYTTNGSIVRVERVLHGARDIDALFVERS